MTSIKHMGQVGLIFLGSLFLFLHITQSTEPHVYISEIGAFEQSGHEWIELYNPGTASVDLENWKFWEAETNHGLIPITRSSSLLSSHEFAIIAQDGDALVNTYPFLSSTLIFDSSWGALNESGEEIGLKDETGTFIELFTYTSSSDFSLERRTAHVATSTIFWKEHPTSSTIGHSNYWNIALTGFTVATSTDHSTSTTTTIPETTTVFLATSTKDLTITTLATSLRINELLPDPTEGTEWIELFNTGTSTVSTTVTLFDAIGMISSTPLVMTSHTFFLVSLPSAKLNNGGDVVTLVHGSSTVDSLSYSKSAKGWSVIRYPDGASTTVQTIKPTPETSNIYTPPPASQPAASSMPAETKKEPSPKKQTPSPTSSTLVYKANIYISEIFPNPVGSDDDTEFVELYNAGLSAVNLSEWQLGDNSSKRYTIDDLIIPPHEYYALLRSQTNIALNNSGKESVFLYNPRGDIVASTTYEHAKEGLSYSRENTTYYWTQTITPHAPSIITVEEIQKEIPTDKETTRSSTHPIPAVHNDISDTARFLQISEFLPNPAGSDDAEFIELYNPSQYTIDLSFLKLDDEEGGSKPYTIPEHTTLSPQSYLLFPRQETGIALNNTGDEVRLLYPNKQIIDSVEYTTVLEGTSYIKDNTDAWTITETATPGTKNILTALAENNTTVSSTKKSSKTQRKNIIIPTTLQQVRQEDLGDTVTLTGTVAVEPGVLGSQYFYIVGSPGLQVYSYKKDFPQLAVGDKLSVTGELTEINGETRLKIKSKDDIAVLEQTQPPKPRPAEISEVGEVLEGWLTQVQGEITEKKSTYLWVDDGTEEVKVYIKKGTHITTKQLNIGDIVVVTGLVSQTKTGYQLLPRSQEDIQRIAISEGAIVEKKRTKDASEQEIAEKYLTATAGGLTSILFGLIITSRKRKKEKEHR